MLAIFASTCHNNSYNNQYLIALLSGNDLVVKAPLELLWHVDAKIANIVHRIPLIQKIELLVPQQKNSQNFLIFSTFFGTLSDIT